MNKLFRRVLSIVLVISLILTSNIPAFAAAEEVYLSELRLVYAEDYDEAKEILKGTNFKDYKLLNENLNEGTKKIGVWLAYKTTTDIDDAITDLSIMQMNGGYNEGNYQEMIKKSREEYKKMSDNYKAAIDYFVEAYDNGDFLAESAYRQLNFYTAITDEDLGIKIPDFDGELLGDIFCEGIDSDELAVMFMEGNSYALDNIRSLIAMGVSYNDDGKHYLKKVGESAAKMNANEAVFDDEDYDDLATIIAGTVITFRDMFKKLATVESQLNYKDEEVTDLELQYSEYQSFADRMREVDYLGGMSLYDFCLNYQLNENDFSKLYPLVDALNDGQIAMTKVLHYYDVVRYSMTDYPEEIMNEEISKLEEIYSENPFNIYNGVDRSIYNGTYALTSEAYRADAYTGDGFAGWLMNKYPHIAAAGGVFGGTGLILSVWGICRSIKAGMMTSAANKAVNAAQLAYNTAWDSAIKSTMEKSITEVLPSSAANTGFTAETTCGEWIDDLLSQAFPGQEFVDPVTQFNMLGVGTAGGRAIEYTQLQTDMINNINNLVTTTSDASQVELQMALTQAKENSARVAEVTGNMSDLTASLYIAGGALLLVSAIQLGFSVLAYYNPTYDDVPVAMVDLIETVDGDRYIKYDVVYEAEPREKDVYTAGDLNAFEAERWNALYYTKSYEAGKPLLADEFTVSASNNKPKSNYTPVHRFGEEVCYDLNKYNFSNKSPSIYLSVKQSKNDKSAVADVPNVVGSIFANGLWMLFGGLGALAGIGGTLGTQALLKKRKTKISEQNT